MMKIVLILLFAFSGAYSLDWSRNDVFKFTPSRVSNFDGLLDYENIEINPYYLTFSAGSNSWFRTADIEVGSNYVLSTLFVNLDITNNCLSMNNTNSYVVLKIKDSRNDRVIQEKAFVTSGSLTLSNVFNKQIYIWAELYGEGIQIYSFGLSRMPEVILQKKETALSPLLLFYGEENLSIDFTLHFPAFLDIIIFNSQGKIVDNLASQQFFKEGRYKIQWNPAYCASKFLISGSNWVYFKVRSVDGKESEITRKFSLSISLR
jgi:hypothetical protein